jgi:hypothetical protein
VTEARPEDRGSSSDLVRDVDGADHLEALIVASAASLLAIRGFLALTNYPKLGGGGLHIAHLLWGGLFLLAAVIVALTWWNPAARWTAALLGGVGFGTFIDELGKFITADNDYFYRPTIALIYAIFVGLYLVGRILFARQPLTPRESLLNQQLRALLAADGAATPSGLWYRAWRARLARDYRRLATHPAFASVLSAIFVVSAISRVLTIGSLMLGGTREQQTVHGIQAAAVVASGVFVVLGALRLPRSRLAAYRWFQRSVLVSILVVQFFLFLESQLAALGGLAVDLLLYLALSYMIRREQERATR